MVILTPNLKSPLVLLSGAGQPRRSVKRTPMQTKLASILFIAVILQSACDDQAQSALSNSSNRRAENMKFHIQYWNAEANGFMQTNHRSDSLAELKELADSDLFLGARIRIADAFQQTHYEPNVRERPEGMPPPDIGEFLNVPTIDLSDDASGKDR